MNPAAPVMKTRIGRIVPTPARSKPSYGRADRPNTSRHFAQLPALDLIYEPAHGVLVRDERRGLDSGDRLADVGVEIREGLGRPLRLDPRLVLDRLLELVVGEREHPAVRLVDQDDLLGP